MNTRTNCHFCGDNVPQLKEDHARLTARVKELDEALKTSNAATLRWMADAAKLDTGNARLRELLQTFKKRLDAKWREGTRVDSYARGYQDGLEAAEVIFDDVCKAAIGEGE